MPPVIMAANTRTQCRCLECMLKSGFDPDGNPQGCFIPRREETQHRTCDLARQRINNNRDLPRAASQVSAQTESPVQQSFSLGSRPPVPPASLINLDSDFHPEVPRFDELIESFGLRDPRLRPSSDKGREIIGPREPTVL